MRDKDIKVVLQRHPGNAGGTCPPESYQIVRIQNSLFVKTEIGEDGRRRGSMHEPELEFFVGDRLTPKQARDIAACYDSTVTAS